MVVTDTINKLSSLPALWTQFRYHEEQQRLWKSRVRFRVVHSGRRSGKTAEAIRFLIICAIAFYAYPNGLFILAAPTHSQAKFIFWDKLKAMIPKWLIVGKPSETELSIKLINGVTIKVVGLDVPSRIEGKEIDGIILDEYANMKPEVWTQHVRPALGTDGRYGWAWFIGVPEGRNHYWLLCNFAKRTTSKNWDSFHWVTADIDPYEAAQAKEEMDAETYAQEYLGAFAHFEGRVYYAFEEDRNAPEAHHISYNPSLPLYVCFDFNVCGSAVILQEQPRPDWATKLTQERKEKLDKLFVLDPFSPEVLQDAQQTSELPHYSQTIIAIIDEVAILKNSNTNKICDIFLKKYGTHANDVYLYGDPAGAAAGSAKVAGSDWDLIRKKLAPVFNTDRRQRLKWRVSKKAPLERVRINATNSRIQSEDGTIRTLIDRIKCPYTIASLSGTILGSDGKIKKEPGELVTHWGDAYGYYCELKHPITGPRATVTAW